MAPKAGKAKPHKTKGEKKKKEEKVLPVVLDITVETPDYSQVTLKVRGTRLKDSVEAASLKPCLLSIVEEDYTEDLAVAHIRRLLDIVACTTAFGPSSAARSGGAGGGGAKPGTKDPGPKSPASDDGAATASPESEAGGGGDANPTKPKQASKKTTKGAGAAPPSVGEAEKGDAAPSIYPPPKLGQFYDFFSFSHLSPPLQYIRRSSRPFLEDKRDDDFFQIDIKICNGKAVTIVASREGFYPAGKRTMLSHSLVGLLQQTSRAFDGAYKALMKAFIEHNKFGNLPYGFRSNTWVVPPIAAESPSLFPPLPTEDENWGGNGGGQGRDGRHDMRKWAREFAILASMPCKTPEERQIRDRKAFLLHTVFVDVSVLKAVAAIQRIVDGHISCPSDHQDAILHEEQIGDLRIEIRRDAPNANAKLEFKNDGSQAPGMSLKELAQRNLLKGITADESATVHDTATLGVVVIRHCGYTAVVKVLVDPDCGGNLPQDVDIEDHSEGGANALNVNSLRLLLHKSSTPQQPGAAQHSNFIDTEDLQSARRLVRKVITDSLDRIQVEDPKQRKSIRWELGACWVQHLQNQASGKNEPKKTEENKVEPAVKGLGEKIGLLKKIKKKTDDRGSKPEIRKETSSNGHSAEASDQKELERNESEKEAMLRNLLSEAAFLRLKETDTGLHTKVELADKLPHVQSLCLHEMIIRAFKHILQAVIAAVDDTAELAGAVASCLNVLLGTLPGDSDDMDLANDYNLKQKWATIYQQKALDINERELGLDHPDTMKSYGDLAVFYYRLQHTELALKYVNRALYLLHLTCGPSHPNTAATYINVAMMEEGLGNIHVALRYLHEALKCNQRLLGADHIQTAASYHAIAIALSLMDAYSLSVQHEQTTLQILQAKLGSEDLRTQDAAAWLEYFESKALEQQEAARNGTPKPDASIASKGHLSVSDLLDYINPDADLKGRDNQRKQARAKIKERLGQNNSETVTGEDQKDATTSPTDTTGENSNDKENSVRSPVMEPKDEKPIVAAIDVFALNQQDDTLLGDASDEGWQEAIPKGRSPSGRRVSKRPSLARLNTNALNAPENARYRGRVANLPSPRTSPNEAPSPGTTAVSPASKKLVKSPSIISRTGTDNPAHAKSAPASPAVAGLPTRPATVASPVGVQSARKPLSYKEVALALPGSLPKSIVEQLPSEKHSEGQNNQASKEASIASEQPPVNQKIECSQVEQEMKDQTIKEKEDNTTEAVVVKASQKMEEVVAAVNEVPKSVTEFRDSNMCSDPETSETGVVEQEVSQVTLPEQPISPAQDAITEVEKAKEEGSEDTHQPPNGGQEEKSSETGKESTRKLSAAAAPYNPTMIPVYSTVTIPSFKDHGGILPPPVNIPPMMTINPVRKPPHQSATARVPYGPRLSGSYHRSGNRGRPKPILPNGDHVVDKNSLSPPKIMNPNAAEFVPGQPWSPNGHPVSPNGCLVDANGIPLTPDSLPASPDGAEVPATVAATEEVDVCTEKATAKAKSEKENEEANHSGSVEEGTLHAKQDATPTVIVAEDVVIKEAPKEVVIEPKQSKCWGDYSDGEADIVDVRG
ncbi:hypothetical protein QJS10_CPB18g00322 [Acorus calamus]|uniref:Clu domain-containing protein n=1 Tax=Acorus calamus TaxID=4465 RepID=A0AAV9CIK7_ACOCL|nr:hypothetical protein QJS10_CPB18g00322 [Acorus calamus]